MPRLRGAPDEGVDAAAAPRGAGELPERRAHVRVDRGLRAGGLDRLTSREIDFGVLWRDGADSSYRAAWIEETGELYVVQAGQPSIGGGHVEVLGVTDRVGVEAALEGWQTPAREHASVAWIRRRAAALPRISRGRRRPPAAARVV